MAKAKKTTKAAAKKTGPKQAELKGMGRKRDKELDSMILALHETRTERIRLLAEEVEMAHALLAKMNAKKLKNYSCWDGETEYPATIHPGVEKVKIAKKEAE